VSGEGRRSPSAVWGLGLCPQKISHKSTLKSRILCIFASWKCLFGSGTKAGFELQSLGPTKYWIDRPHVCRPSQPPTVHPICLLSIWAKRTLCTLWNVYSIITYLIFDQFCLVPPWCLVRLWVNPVLVVVVVVVLYTSVECRSSVLLVCGTRLNTRRSPSVIRLVSSGWRWPGTVETPVMLWLVNKTPTTSPTARCLPRTTTTTTRILTTLLFPSLAAHLKEGGGTRVCRLPGSTEMTSAYGRPMLILLLPVTSRPAACWSESTSEH